MKDLLWVPLDIPRYELEVPLSELINYYDQQGHIASRWWDVIALRGLVDAGSGERSNLWRQTEYDGDWVWTDTATQKLPGLIAYIIEHIPLRTVTYAALTNPVGKVDAHRDVRREEHWAPLLPLEPTQYRLVVQGHMGSSFFMAETKDGPRRYCQHPPESGGFVFRDHDTYHGNDNPEPGARRMVYVSGMPDPDRHRALIERSLAKYGEYAVWRETGAEDRI